MANESDKIIYYLCEKGMPVTGIYLLEVLIEAIILLYIKSI